MKVGFCQVYFKDVLNIAAAARTGIRQGRHLPDKHPHLAQRDGVREVILPRQQGQRTEKPKNERAATLRRTDPYIHSSTVIFSHGARKVFPQLIHKRQPIDDRQRPHPPNAGNQNGNSKILGLQNKHKAPSKQKNTPMKNRTMISRFLPFSATMASLAALVQPVSAVILFDNGFGMNASGFFADTQFNSVVADDFVFGSEATITSLAWSGTYYSGNTPANPDGFSVYFFSDAGGWPGSIISLQSVPVVRENSGLKDANFGLDIFTYSADLTTPLTLEAGTYWLGLMNDTPTTTDHWLWAGGPQTIGAASRRSSDGGATFHSTDGTPQKNFVLNGAVIPEPSTTALMMGCVALVAVYLRRRNRAA